MRNNKSQTSALPIAVRVYPELNSATQNSTEHTNRRFQLPKNWIVLDTETRTDSTQRLMFGCYRIYHSGTCVEEGITQADDLSAQEQRTLREYVSGRELRLLTRDAFLDRFFTTAYKGRYLVVAFNFPFDISRLANEFTTARGRFAGGFSLGLWTYPATDGQMRRDQFRPRVGIKHIDSKRALKGFTGRNEPDTEDLIPEGSLDGKPEKDYIFRGNFLDLRTLAFALTDKGHSLASACEAFGVEHPKQVVTEHGKITPKYIDYNRRDVLATAELATKLLEEYAKHPIDLQPTKAYSPASIGKAYLRKMGIAPILERQPDFPKKYLGYAQSAFFGGRTSAHIRKVAVPVRYLDFVSMYPTVNSNMGLWRFVTAERIEVIDNCSDEFRAFLQQFTNNVDPLFNAETWKHLTGFAKVIPNGNILPNRAKYSNASNDWQVALNYVYAADNDQNGLWFSYPDIVASVILTGKLPKIVEAFRIEPRGQLTTLNPIKLRGTIEINPSKSDFFKVVIEERKRIEKRHDLTVEERERLQKSLKVLANSASYGIYAEMIRQESDEEQWVTCHAVDSTPYTCRVSHPERPGEYCFPPLASLITGAARLMLALLEYCVTERGGTYAMEDTDSMAVVATKTGGLTPCEGGTSRLKGKPAIKALSWADVDTIVSRFTTLKPYDPTAIKNSILKIEDDNYDLDTEEDRQLYCIAISAKRYVLCVRDKKNKLVLLRKGLNNAKNHWSEHGLGHLLNPSDTHGNNREWVGGVWDKIVRNVEGSRIAPLSFEHLPAMGRTNVSSPVVMRGFGNMNDGKSYAEQVKPFNFLLTAHVSRFGHPLGVDESKFHLITSYETDPNKWLGMTFVDQYSRKEFKVTTSGTPTRKTARVNTYGDVIAEYEFHPEAKCADAEGNSCGKQTRGLLQRRHVHIEQIRYIGKESNLLEQVESGEFHSADDVYTEYPDPRRSEWASKTLPALKALRLADATQMFPKFSRRMLINVRAGRSTPHVRNQRIIATILKDDPSQDRRSKVPRK